MKWPRMREEAVRQRAFLAAMRVAYARWELADRVIPQDAPERRNQEGERKKYHNKEAMF